MNKDYYYTVVQKKTTAGWVDLASFTGWWGWFNFDWLARHRAEKFIKRYIEKNPKAVLRYGVVCG